MKLTKVIFNNFRLLRNLELDFSSDQGKKLTVIRAENESGKTTTLLGLQWGLYGDDALPDKGKNYRLHPIDWNFEEQKVVEIDVTIEFEHTIPIPQPGGTFREDIRKYRLIRNTNEELEDNNFIRRSSDIFLYQLLPEGDKLIEYPESELQDMLPLELREVFFTDGDRALSFIEASISKATKRKRVYDAVKSLLGLNIIENAKQHINTAIADVNKRVKDISTDKDITKCSTRLEQITEELEELRPKKANLSEQLSNTEIQLNEIDKEISVLLRKGNEEELKNEFVSVKNQLSSLQKTYSDLQKKHSSLFKDQSLIRNLISDKIESAMSRLSDMKDKGTIPSSTIPVLKERLELGVCICGESLSDPSKESSVRKKYIENIIKEQQETDRFRKKLTDLYYSAIQHESNGNLTTWLDKFKNIFGERHRVDQLIKDTRKKEKDIDLKLEKLKNTDLSALRQRKLTLEEIKEKIIREQEQTYAKIKYLENEESFFKKQRDNFLRKHTHNLKLLSELEVAQDLQNILSNSYNAILNEELDKVSELMNICFLKMIGADPEQGAIINKALITKEFDILVYGPNERLLNPDIDLNGASRRALTLSFILALTRVSEVDAPNIIDTPLGMTSGFVKRSILSETIFNSSQLILFLTPSEIKDCEDIIDVNAGIVNTFTNAAHYPEMLKNKPNTSDYRILICKCNHHQECSICERINNNTLNELEQIQEGEQVG